MLQGTKPRALMGGKSAFVLGWGHSSPGLGLPSDLGVRAGVGRDKSSGVTTGAGRTMRVKAPCDGSTVPGGPLGVMTGMAPAGPTLCLCPKLLTRGRWMGPCRLARRGSARKLGTRTDSVLERLPAPLTSPVTRAIPLGSGGPARGPSPLDPLQLLYWKPWAKEPWCQTVCGGRSLAAPPWSQGS